MSTETPSTSAESFDLETWKREFSNSTNPEETMKWFLEHFDPSAYTISICSLEDLPTMDFIRANRINGYLQQFDPKLHRTAFGVILVNPETPTTATGIWVCEKDELPIEALKKVLDKSLKTVTKVIDRERANLTEIDFELPMAKIIKKSNNLNRSLHEIIMECQAQEQVILDLKQQLETLNESSSEEATIQLPKLMIESDLYEIGQWRTVENIEGDEVDLKKYFFPSEESEYFVFK